MLDEASVKTSPKAIPTKAAEPNWERGRGLLVGLAGKVVWHVAWAALCDLMASVKGKGYRLRYETYVEVDRLRGRLATCRVVRKLGE